MYKQTNYIFYFTLTAEEQMIAATCKWEFKSFNSIQMISDLTRYN